MSGLNGASSFLRLLQFGALDRPQHAVGGFEQDAAVGRFDDHAAVDGPLLAVVSELDLLELGRNRRLLRRRLGFRNGHRIGSRRAEDERQQTGNERSWKAGHSAADCV